MVVEDGARARGDCDGGSDERGEREVSEVRCLEKVAEGAGIFDGVLLMATKGIFEMW